MIGRVGGLHRCRTVDGLLHVLYQLDGEEPSADCQVRIMRCCRSLRSAHGVRMRYAPVINTDVVL